MAAAPARTLSDQLRDAIRECGLSVGQLARKADVDDGIIHRFLSGERGLTTGTLDKLGEAMGLRIVEARAAGRPKKARD